jgi:hypothetical protein
MSESLTTLDLNYNWPFEYFRPGNKLHDDTLKTLMDMARRGISTYDTCRSERRAIDRQMQAFIPLDEEDKRQQSLGAKRPMKIVVPLLYATHETAMTYFTAAHCGKPIHKYSGEGGIEGVIRAAKMERIVTRQHDWFKTKLALQTAMSDCLKYGVGVVTPEWSKHYGVSPNTVEVNGRIQAVLASRGIEYDVGRHVIEEQELLWEGNKTRAIDPYRFSWDPNVSPNDIQEAEHMEWQHMGSAKRLLRDEADPEMGLFNGKASAWLSDRGEGICDELWEPYVDARDDRNGKPNMPDGTNNKALHFLTMVVEIVPSEWKFSDSDKPETWEFLITGGQVINKAKKLNYWHGRKPVAMCAPNTDGHGTVPVSHLGTFFALQYGANWLLNTRMANVAKVINDMLLVNPFAIEWDDLMEGGEGKIIRITPEFYRSTAPLSAYAQQLPVQDVTQGHIGDFNNFMQLTKTLSGFGDTVDGNILSSSPDRPTAAGIDAATGGGAAKVEYISGRIGTQMLDELSFQEMWNNRQFLQSSQRVELFGRMEQDLRKIYGSEITDLLVTPDDIRGPINCVPHDGSNSQIRNLSAQTEVIKTLLGVEGAAQEIQSKTDFSTMFFDWARASGYENVSAYIKSGAPLPQIQYATPEQTEAGMQSGNMVPVGSLANAR